MLKRFSIYAMFLCIVPILAWLFNWHWQIDHTYDGFSYVLYILTETAGKPYSIITSAIFAFVYFWQLKNKKMALKVVAVMALVVCFTLGIKSVVKPLVQEDRPFMQQILMTLPQGEHFYQLKKSQRARLVKQFHQHNAPQTPQWLIQHRASKTGFAFPSGHSMFVATWVMLLVGFAGIFSRYPLFAYLAKGATIWAMLVLLSRLQLGMHFPIDEIVSIFIAWAVNVGVFYFLRQYRWE